jgi:type 1 fimbria pilin
MSGILINPYSFPVTSPTIFQDNFDDNSIDPALWSVSAWLAQSQTGVTIAEASQQLTITLPANASGSFYNSLLSVPVMDFQDKTLDCDFVTYPDPAHETNCGLEIVKASDSSKFARLTTSIGNMQMRASAPNNTGFQFVGSSYSTYQKWRIQHVSSSNQWKFYSYDGASWTLRRTSTAQAWTPNDMQVRILAGTFASITAPGVFTVDNLTTDATY